MELPVSPPGWGMAVGQVGSVLVWLAVGSFLASAVTSVMSGRRPELEPWSRRLFWAGSGGLFSVFGLLFFLFLTNQYQYLYVFSHSQLDYELHFKIAGVWAGQEGSILLWSCLTALFGLLTVKKFRVIGPWYGGAYAGLSALMAGISAYESPFKLVTDASGAPILPPDGRGMSPALLNYWMVIHPPTIFVGFALTAVAFCASIAALNSRSLDAWIPMVRPWALACLGILGLGLCMGGFWAYETLGWGGFWVWDPVENTSFVPWCAMAAFTHGIIVQQAKKRWHFTNAILGAAPFLLFCYGTFLTRSGFLGDTSVHSFAKMDPQARGILVGLMGGALAGFLASYIPALSIIKAREKGASSEAAEEKFWNKTNLYGMAMWILFAFGLVTAIGMSVPLMQSLAGQKPKVVEEFLYNQVLGYFYVPGMLILAITPFATWKGETLKSLLGKVMNPLAMAVMFTGFLLLWTRWGWFGLAADPEATSVAAGFLTVPKAPFVAFLAFLCFFAIFSNLYRLASMLPRGAKTAGGVITHVGVALTILGLIVSRGLQQKTLVVVHPSKPAEAFGWQINYVGPTKGFENRKNEVKLSVSGPGGQFTAHPGLYFRPGPEGPQETIWPHIERRALYDLYMTLHPMVWEASESQGLSSGQQARFENMIVTYEGMRSTGTLGTESAQFFAKSKVQVLGPAQSVRPQILLGATQASQPAPLAGGKSLTLLKANVDEGSVVLALSTSPDKPLSLIQGASIVADGLRVTFNSLSTVQGHSPEEAVLAADLTVEEVERTMTVEPWMSMSDEGKVRLTEDYELALERIDAGTKAAFFRFDYVRPAYPLEFFYKPLTWMVWLGVGIMTLGALWSARGRRTSRPQEANQDEAAANPKTEEKESSDAPLPVA
jgi:cytochrome c-type biogenesis protein CcmF